MAMKNALRERAKKTFSGNVLQTLYSRVVPHDKIYRIEQVAWEIDKETSGGNTRVRFFIEGHGYNHYLEEQAAPGPVTLYTYSEPHSLVPGERLALEIDYGQDATTAEMHLTGYWTEFKEGIVT